MGDFCTVSLSGWSIKKKLCQEDFIKVTYIYLCLPILETVLLPASHLEWKIKRFTKYDPQDKSEKMKLKIKLQTNFPLFHHQDVQGGEVWWG